MPIHERVRRRRLRRFFSTLVILCCFALLGGGFYEFFWSGFFAVQKIVVNGAETVDPQAIEKRAAEFLSGKVFGIFPKNHFLFLNQRLIAAGIEATFPRVASAEPAYHLRAHTLTVQVEERKPAAYWCHANGACFLVDDVGVIFDEAVSTSTGAVVLKINDQTNRNLRIGMKAFSNEGMATMLDLYQNLKPDVVIVGFAIEEESSGAHYVRADTQDGWYFYADTLGDPDTTINDLKALLAQEIGARRNRLAYIDLRVPGRAYYKLR